MHTIVREEGVRGLWKGTLAAELLVVPYVNHHAPTLHLIHISHVLTMRICIYMYAPALAYVRILSVMVMTGCHLIRSVSVVSFASLRISPETERSRGERRVGLGGRPGRDCIHVPARPAPHTHGRTADALLYLAATWYIECRAATGRAWTVCGHVCDGVWHHTLLRCAVHRI